MNCKYDSRLERSMSYRSQFIALNQGWRSLYMCVYCGKIVARKNMEVDHLIPVALAQRSKFYRKILFKRAETVNSQENLVPSCKQCNKKKGPKGGLWIIRGLLGRILQPILWVIFILILVIFTILFFLTFSI